MNILKQTISLFILLSLLFSITIKAETSDEILNQLSLKAILELPMIDIATGYAVPLESAPAVATIITADEIERMGAETLDEVLNTVPGLHITPSLFSRTDSVSSIRGIYTGFNPQVLVMLNGVRLTNPFSGGFLPNYRINLKSISKIEVVRGPGSAIYGADAFSGVINLVTKNAQELKRTTHLGTRLGSDNLRNFWWQYGTTFSEGKQKIEDWHFSSHLEFAKRDADRSRKVDSDLQSTFDGLFSTNASLAPSYIDRRYQALTYNLQFYNKNWIFRLDGTNQRDNGVGSGAAQALDHQGSDDLDQILTSAEYKNDDSFKNWHLNSKISYLYSNLDSDFTLFPAGSTLLIGKDGNIDFNTPGVPVTFSQGVIGQPNLKQQTAQFDLTALYLRLQYHTMRFNIGIRHEKVTEGNRANFGPSVLDNPVPSSVIDGTLTSTTGTPFSFVKNSSRTIKFVSFQDIWDITGNWAITSGIRYDHYSDFGKTINPRFALVWTNGFFTSKLLYGQAFRAPSFSELHSINNPVILGNPNLDPETTETTELAFGWTPSWDVNADINLYRYKTKDMIAFVPEGNTGTSIAQNINSLKGKGVEFSIDWNISKTWHLNANYAYQKTIDGKTNKQQPFVPKQFGTVSLAWLFHPDWKLASQFDWIADRKREAGDSRSALDDYTLTNLSLHYKPEVGHWKTGLTVKNIFDQKVYEPSDGKIPDDYPLGERSIFATIEYVFKKRKRKL